MLTSAREVLARLERYELEVFEDENGSKSALEKAGRRKAAAQVSLFDLANQKVIKEIRTAPNSLSADDAKELLLKLKERLV